MLQAEKSIRKYGVHAVVANILETRKEVVHIVRPANADNGKTVEVEKILRCQEQFIEKPLVTCVVALHKAYEESK